MSDTVQKALPNWLMILIYLGILAILAIFGDLFIFILGLILETLVFALGHDFSHKSH